MPPMIFPSVDFPAPFWPTSACVSPTRMSRSTAARAWVAPKRLETPRSLTAVSVKGSALPFSLEVGVLLEELRGHDGADGCEHVHVDDGLVLLTVELGRQELERLLAHRAWEVGVGRVPATLAHRVHRVLRRAGTDEEQVLDGEAGIGDGDLRARDV